VAKAYGFCKRDLPGHKKVVKMALIPVDLAMTKSKATAIRIYG
jgi:hypothetical protein